MVSYTYYDTMCEMFDPGNCDNGWSQSTGGAVLNPGQGFILGTSATLPGPFLKFYLETD